MSKQVALLPGPHQCYPLTPQQEAEQLTALLPLVNREQGGQRIVFENGAFVWVTAKRRMVVSIHWFEVSRFIKQVASLYSAEDDREKRKKK